jgi:sec-independent protein translocase protein TatC
MPKGNENSDYDPEATRMTLGEHLDELRVRIIRSLIGLAVGTAVGLASGKQLVWLLVWPYRVAATELGMAPELAVMSAGAGFDSYMKISFYFGLILACPWIVYQLWMFIAAGLYPKERRYVSSTVPLLFLAGAAFFVLAVAVPAIRFLLMFDHWMGLKPVVTLQSHIGFMTDMILAFGLAFQTPLAIYILAKVGLVSMGTLHKYRKHAIFAILVFSAVFAPPDALSMLAMAGPMWLLYEFGVVLAYFAIRKQRRQEEMERRQEESGGEPDPDPVDEHDALLG